MQHRSDFTGNSRKGLKKDRTGGEPGGQLGENDGAIMRARSFFLRASTARINEFP